MPTEYTPINQEFSDKAHKAAQKLLYPLLFNVKQDALEFIDTSLKLGKTEAFLDGTMAIDRIVKVTVSGLEKALPFTIQERFRRPYAANFRDLTITEWNHTTNLPSELYKLQAMLFVYGYYDEEENRFIEAVVVDIPRFMLHLQRGHIKYTHERNKKNQTFLGFHFDELIRCRCILKHFKRN